MRKIAVIARREYLAAVRTKTFLVGLLIMPLMMGASALIQYLVRDMVDVETKQFIVVDRTKSNADPAKPGLIEIFKEKVEKYNKESLDSNTEIPIRPQFGVEKTLEDYNIKEVDPADSEAVSKQRHELSQLVRDGKIVGFLEFTPLDPKSPKQNAAITLRYQSNRANYMDFVIFAENVVAEHLRKQIVKRMEEKGLPRKDAQTLVQPVDLQNLGLATMTAEGEIVDDNEQSRYGTMIVPSILLVLMFMLVLMGSTPLMQGVVEEKMQRIAEVLLGSVRPFELMLGKLIGMTGVSLTMGGFYLAGAYWAAQRYGLSDALTLPILLWFVVFQVLASLMFGSLFIAVGAACTEMKETQNLVLPIMLLATMPMFLMGSILREPNGPVVRALSFFPFSTPALMIARMSILPNMPFWEPLLGIVIVLAATLLCVWIAGRIFRVGILLQGKGAGFGQILKWIIRG